MTAADVFRLADLKQIQIINFHIPNKKAFCVNSTIAIDFPRIITERELKQVLSEEVGHVATAALYPLRDCITRLGRLNIRKQERKAQDYSNRLQVPLGELKRALKKSTDDFEIADALDVDIDTLQNAVALYRQKGKL